MILDPKSSELYRSDKMLLEVVDVKIGLWKYDTHTLYHYFTNIHKSEENVIQRRTVTLKSVLGLNKKYNCHCQVSKLSRTSH